MKYILISVKDLTQAKQRLAPVMTQEERTSLAWFMLEHIFKETARARGYDGVAVITSYGPAIDLAHDFEFEVIKETTQVSESVSVDYGSQFLRGKGVRSVLSLPIDLPLVNAQDLETLASRINDEPSVVIVPSRDETGTNAIIRTPPDLFPSHFGPNSLTKHLAEAERCGAQYELIRLPHVAFDLDNAQDLAYLMENGEGCSTYNMLRELKLDQRLTLD